MSAAEMRKLHALSTAKKPSLRAAEIVDALADLYDALVEVPLEQRAEAVKERRQIDRPALALLVWRFTPLSLELKADDRLLTHVQAGDAALAVVRFGSEKVQDAFLNDVLANAGHPGLMRLFYSVVEGLPPARVVAALEALVKDGNDLHLFNVLHFLSEAGARGYPYASFDLVQRARKQADKSKIGLVRAAAAAP